MNDTHVSLTAARAKTGKFGRAAMFLREYLRSPATIGAVAPSSPRLARLMADLADVSRSRHILEFGPGTGAFTRVILKAMPADASVVLVECNEHLCHVLRHRFPLVNVVHDTVENVGTILSQRGLGQADCILCGLPWAAFDDDLQDRLLRATLDALSPGGRFVTFTYIHSPLKPQGKRFRLRIHELFSEVQISPLVWQNLPPAFVYRCVK